MSLRRTILALLALTAVIAFALSACLPSARFPACKSAEDCADKGNKKICFDTRCVQCTSDGDCGEGEFCEHRTSECESIGDVPTTPGSASAAPSAAPVTE